MQLMTKIGYRIHSNLAYRFEFGNGITNSKTFI